MTTEILFLVLTRDGSDADADGGEQGGDVPHVVCPGSFYL